MVRGAHRRPPIGWWTFGPLGSLGMASLQTLERRILALEARLAEVEGGYGNTLYELHRASVRNDLRMGKLLARLEVEDVSDDEVDAVLEEE